MMISGAGCDFGLKQTIREALFSATAISIKAKLFKGKTAKISKTVEN